MDANSASKGRTHPLIDSMMQLNYRTHTREQNEAQSVTFIGSAYLTWYIIQNECEGPRVEGDYCGQSGRKHHRINTQNNRSAEGWVSKTRRTKKTAFSPFDFKHQTTRSDSYTWWLHKYVEREAKFLCSFCWLLCFSIPPGRDAIAEIYTRNEKLHCSGGGALKIWSLACSCNHIRISQYNVLFI
jgi:hypothetical protein